MTPSHGFRLCRSGRLVAFGSSELGAAQSVHSVLSAPSHSGICAVRVGVLLCSLTHCGAPWLMALRSGHCRITAGLASMDGTLLVSSVESQLCECPFVELQRQLVGSGVCSPASPICPTSSVVKRSSFGLFASVSCQVFTMRSPCRVEFVSNLDRNEVSCRSFPSGWCRAFAMGPPVLGHVPLFCALDWNEGFFRSSILSCFAMGSPCGSSVFSPTRS